MVVVGRWLQWKAGDHNSASVSSSTQQAASFPSSVSSVGNCKQHEFLYLPLTFQADDSAEVVSQGDDYPNKCAFKLLLDVKAALR